MSIFGFHLDLNPNYGAYLIGTFVSNVLLGATCVQTYIYFREYQDSLFIQATVLTLLILELLHGAFSMRAMYYYLVTNFLNPIALLTDIWSVTILFGVLGLIILIVHLSYATRIYYVSGKRIVIPIIIGIVSFTNLGLGFTLMGVLFHNPTVSSLTGAPDKLAKGVLITTAVDDFLIAGTLSFYLNRARTGIKQTDKTIDRLMIATINNGILTSLFDIISLVLVFTRPTDLYSLAVSQVIGNLYSNSWMATLNSRTRRSKFDHSSNEIASRGLSTFGAASSGEIAPTASDSTAISSNGWQ